METLLKLLQAPDKHFFPELVSTPEGLLYLLHVILFQAEYSFLIKTSSPLPTGNDDSTFEREKNRHLRHLQVCLFLKNQEAVFAASWMVAYKKSSLCLRGDCSREQRRVSGGCLGERCMSDSAAWLSACRVSQWSSDSAKVPLVNWLSGLRSSPGHRSQPVPSFGREACGR